VLTSVVSGVVKVTKTSSDAAPAAKVPPVAGREVVFAAEGSSIILLFAQPPR
jgi:hypothetical protein